MNTGALTPRLRQEIEPRPLMDTRRPMGIVRTRTVATTLITARADADYVFEAMWGCNTTSSNLQYSLYIVTGAEPIGSSNIIISGSTMPANMTDIIQGASGVMLQAGQSLVATCTVNNGMNFFGHGWDIKGSYQS